MHIQRSNHLLIYYKSMQLSYLLKCIKIRVQRVLTFHTSTTLHEQTLYVLLKCSVDNRDGIWKASLVAGVRDQGHFSVHSPLQASAYVAHLHQAA